MDSANITRKEPKPDKDGHENGKSTQEPGSFNNGQQKSTMVKPNPFTCLTWQRDSKYQAPSQQANTSPRALIGQAIIRELHVVEAQKLQGVGIATLAIRVLYFHPRATKQDPMIRMLQHHARRQSPSIIFVEDLDIIGGEQRNSESDVASKQYHHRSCPPPPQLAITIATCCLPPSLLNTTTLVVSKVTAIKVDLIVEALFGYGAQRLSFAYALCVFSNAFMWFLSAIQQHSDPFAARNITKRVLDFGPIADTAAGTNVVAPQRSNTELEAITSGPSVSDGCLQYGVQLHSNLLQETNKLQSGSRRTYGSVVFDVMSK
ncbi:hypothetical protein Tco_1076465, partial [Tanacetum coccineum]